MTKTAVEGLALIFLLLLAAVLGYGYRGDRNQASISTAEANFATCKSALDGNQAQTVVLQAKFKDLQERHDKALAAATLALEGRDQTISTLTLSTKKRTNTLRTSTHEDATCAPLKSLPLCAAIAGQLWPPAAEASTGDHAH